MENASPPRRRGRIFVAFVVLTVTSIYGGWIGNCIYDLTKDLIPSLVAKPRQPDEVPPEPAGERPSERKPTPAEQRLLKLAEEAEVIGKDIEKGREQDK